MAALTTTRKERNKGIKYKNWLTLSIILLLTVGAPLMILIFQSGKSGMSMHEVLQRKILRRAVDTLSSANRPEASVGEKIDFLDPIPVGLPFREQPMIANLAVTDLDGDDLLDIVVCDAKNNFVSWIRQGPAGDYSEKVIASGLIAPAHVQVIDFDRDGDKDLMVALLGLLFPSNDKIGSVIILENDGRQQFRTHTVEEKIARVSDVRAGDLDGDGDLDLAVAQFGYDDGETRWIENLGNWQFKSHILQNLSGPINVEVIDIDKDNDLDIVSLVSQEWEEIYCFLNDGKGGFQTRLLWGSDNEDFGSSGIMMADLNQDGKTDILYTNGDAFDYIPPRGRPWHGLQWFENKGDLQFVFHRICTLVGAYSPRPADVDGDGDQDLFVVSAFNLWEDPASQSFIWVENTGNMQFVQRAITNHPTHLITLETGDFNNDGHMDFVTGGMYPYPPYDRMSRVTLWMNKGMPPATMNP